MEPNKKPKEKFWPPTPESILGVRGTTTPRSKIGLGVILLLVDFYFLSSPELGDTKLAVALFTIAGIWNIYRGVKQARASK